MQADIISGNEELVRAELGGPVMIDRDSGLVRYLPDVRGIKTRFHEILNAQDIGLYEFKKVVFRYGNLL